MKFCTPIIGALVGILLTGCATRGAGYVPLVDMQGQSEVRFQSDLRECQAYATQRLDAAQGAMAGALLGAILGAAIAPRGYRGNVAGHGAAVGAIGGAGAATDNQETIIKRCLAGRGYNVLN